MIWTQQNKDKFVAYLRAQHQFSCEARGEHPDEVETAYSVGADAIERVFAIDIKEPSDG